MMIEYASREGETYIKKERGQEKPRQVLLLLLILVVMAVVEMKAACDYVDVCVFGFDRCVRNEAGPSKKF